MTDADWAGDVKDRRSYSGIAVWVKSSVENTWYPVCASSKKQNMVCLSSGESELMALGWCRTERPMEQDVQLLTCDDCAVHGQFSSSGIRETQGCESTHSPRGHEGLFYAGLGDGTWTTYLENTLGQLTSCRLPHKNHNSSSSSPKSTWNLTDAPFVEGR